MRVNRFIRRWLANEAIYFIGLWIIEHRGKYPDWFIVNEPLAKFSDIIHES